MNPNFLKIFLCITLLLATGCSPKEEANTQKNSGVVQANGETIYNQNCAACHDRGLAGAPRNGTKADWTTAIAAGIEVMVEHSIHGFKGHRGFMPARGGHPELSDNEVTAAVNYLAQQNK